MKMHRTALIGLLCLGLTFAYNCDVPGHDHTGDHSAAASQQSFQSSSANLIGANSIYSTNVPSYVNNNNNNMFFKQNGVGNNRNDIQDNNVPYWWMGNPSPFKIEGAPGCNPDDGCKAGGQFINQFTTNINTYEHKMDLSKNPFINGQYASNKHTETVAVSQQTNNNKQNNEFIHLGNNPFLSGVMSNNKHSQFTQTQSNENSNSNSGLGFNSNSNTNTHNVIHPPIPQHHGFGVINTKGIHHHNHHNNDNSQQQQQQQQSASSSVSGNAFNSNNGKISQTTTTVFGESGQNRNNNLNVVPCNNNDNTVLEQYQTVYKTSGSSNNKEFSGNPFINVPHNHIGSASSISGSAATFGQQVNNPLFNGIPQPSNSGNNNFVSSSAFISTTGTGGKTQYTSNAHNSFIDQNQFTQQTQQNADYGNLNIDRGYLPPQPKTTTCSGPNTVCAKKNICPNGVMTDQQVAQSRLTINGPNQNQFCDIDTEVCCKVQVTPPVTRPPPVTPTQRPQPPPPTPTPVRPIVTQRPQTPPPQPPQPPRPQTVPCGQKNTRCVTPEICVNGYISRNAPPNVLNQAPSDKCYAPEVCCAIPEVVPNPNTIFPKVTTPSKEYLPQTERTTTRYIPPVTQPPTKRPIVQPIPDDSSIIPVKRPNKPYQPQEYLPPKDDDISGSSSNTNPDVLRPVKKPQPRPNEPNLSPAPANELPTIVRPTEGISLPPSAACAAALKCTRIEYCSMTGMIVKTPIQVTPEQELFRVPMTDCRNAEEGFTGKCCRDPDYTDPWPVGQLGQYNASWFGDDGSYKSTSRGKYTHVQPVQPVRGGVCQPVYRDRRSQPRGTGKIDTGFGEIPWQAMVLLDTNRSLLCGGSIISDDAVITSASCVHQFKPTEIMIKGGEWRLGVDEEPKTFQIIRVKEVSIDPRFKPGGNDRDVAILHLEDRLKFDTHIQPICIEDPEWAAKEPDEECITTGWGREVLKIHIQNALMHVLNVTSIPEKQCVDELSRYGFNKNASFCGKPVGGDACETDTGSGLACNIGNDYYYLRGIYTGETQCGESTKQTGYYSKIDINWVAAAFREPGLKTYNPDDPYGLQQPSASAPGGVKTVKRTYRHQTPQRRYNQRRY